MANDIRDNERNGRATVHMIEESSEPEAVIKVGSIFTLTSNQKTSGSICGCNLSNLFEFLGGYNK